MRITTPAIVVLNMIDRKKDPYYYKNYVYKYENYYSSHDEK
jgi:hypothetical protein